MGDANETSTAPAPAALVTKLYRHDCPYECCPSRWSEFSTFTDEDAATKAKTALVPIVHRHQHMDNSWRTADFTVNDTFMQGLLSKALDKYQDLDMSLENWTFTPPYMPLVHRWEKLKEFHAKSNEDETVTDDEKKTADALLDFLGPVLSSSVDALAKTHETGKILFSDIWQIFPPGELVVTKFYGIDTVCRVLKYTLKETRTGDYWIIKMEYVDWDGSRCGYDTTSVVISQYRGLSHVKFLPVYPLSFHPDPEDLKDKLIKRGRKFEELRGFHFRAYKGKRILMDAGEERPVSGRVVIDAYAYYTSSNLVKPKLRPLNTNDDDDAEDDEDAEDGTSRVKPPRRPSLDETQSTSGSDSGSDSGSIFKGPIKTLTRTNEVLGRNEELEALTDEQCLMANSWLVGFDLKSKEWGHLHVTDLVDIVWNYDAFSNLVLPSDEKELAWSFVESKTVSDEAFDDFIPDKGRGIIILMFGPPGK